MNHTTRSKKKGAVHVLADNGSLKQNLSGKRQILLLHIRVLLEDIQLLGRRFPWKKPTRCPRCYNRRLWGHGFVLRYFASCTEGLWLRRWRCPDCRAVHTTRPAEYPPGSAYPAELRNRSIFTKLNGGTYLPEVPRQNQQYWKRAFEFTIRWAENWPSAKDFLKQQVIVAHQPVSFSIKYRVIPSGLDPPYLDFAVTWGPLPVNFR